MKVIPVNGTDRSWTRHRYILWFGAHTPKYLMVWANSLDDGLDIAVDWLVEHAPGILADDAVQEAYEEALQEGKTPEEADEVSTMDMTCAGNCGNYLRSWEWGIEAEDPTRAHVLRLNAA